MSADFEGVHRTKSNPQITQISQIRKKRQPRKGTKSSKENFCFRISLVEKLPAVFDFICAFCAFLWPMFFYLCNLRMNYSSSSPLTLRIRIVESAGEGLEFGEG